jgi:hypothetical protein
MGAMANIDRTKIAPDLLWPYNGIVRDLNIAVENGCNYLAALGLICWSEFIGRQIALTRGEPEGSNFDCFKRFVTGYMCYDLGPSAGAVYGAFRDGLVHEFSSRAATLRSRPSCTRSDRRRIPSRVSPSIRTRSPRLLRTGVLP